MAWQHDQPPLNYLKRRVKYYKKKIAENMNYVPEEHILDKYGEEAVEAMVARNTVRMKKRIAEFQKAIRILSRYNTIKRNG